MANETQYEFVNQVILSNGEVLIDLSKDDVTPENVKAGIKFHDQTGAEREGTNTNTVDASGVTTSPEEVLEGKKFGKGDKIVTGTMPNKKGQHITLTNDVVSNASGQSIPRGYYDQATYIQLSQADATYLKPENIKQGIEILGVEGKYGADDMSSKVLTVAPSFEEQNFNPADEDVSFYSAVKVEPIKVTRTDNDARGVTVTIG